MSIKKTRGIILWFVPLLMVVCGGWYFLSDSALMCGPFNEHKHVNTGFVEDGISKLGPEAIPVLISEIKKTFVGNKCFTHYPNALTSFKLRGKEALIREIDECINPIEQFRLIIALQKAFNDYSKFPLWIDKAVSGDYGTLQLVFMSDMVSRTYAGAPSLRDPKHQNSLNPEFREWWITRKEGENVSFQSYSTSLRPVSLAKLERK